MSACAPCDFTETHCMPALEYCDAVTGELTPCEVCVPGYEGSTCTEEIDECADQPCKNGGTCIDQIADFSCLCPNWTTGDTCSDIIDVLPPSIEESSLPSQGEHGKNKTFSATVAVADDLSGMASLTWIYGNETLSTEANIEQEGGSFTIQFDASNQQGVKELLQIELTDIAGNSQTYPLFYVEAIKKEIVCYGCGKNEVVIPKTCYETCYDTCQKCSPKYCPDNPNCTWCCNQDYIDPQCEGWCTGGAPEWVGCYWYECGTTCSNYNCNPHNCNPYDCSETIVEHYDTVTVETHFVVTYP